jgi:WhiB family redox-sensing transcriptional regulator
MAPTLFFPEPDPADRTIYDPAKAVCARCPVRLACLGEALANREIRGVWGGLTVAERARIARPQREQVS